MRENVKSDVGCANYFVTIHGRMDQQKQPQAYTNKPAFGGGVAVKKTAQRF
jgi:hypothetical protein